MNPLEHVKMVDRCGAAEPVKPADRAEPEAQLERIHEALLRPEPTPAVERILHKALDGHRISYEEGCVLMREGDLGSLGLVAGEITRRLHPDNIVTFVVDRNINYTNVCVTDCKFCAFYRHEKDPDAWVLSHDEILQKVGELAREVNHRWGPKKKKPTEDTGDVALELGDILFVVAVLANQMNIDLEEAFRRVMDKYRTRDADRWVRRTTAEGEG